MASHEPLCSLDDSVRFRGGQPRYHARARRTSMAQVTTTVHDVVVIGSGAGGGTATKVLADLGVSVLLMEAGPMLNMADLKEHMSPYNVPHRGAGPKGEAYTGGRPASPTARPTAARSSKASPTPSRPAATSPGSGRASSAAAPITTAASRCASPTTTSSRARSTGSASTGRSPTTTWRRTTTRRNASSAWSARAENIRSAPDGIFHTPAALRAHDVLVQRSCAKLGIRAVPARQAVITSPRNGRPPATTAASAAAAA